MYARDAKGNRKEVKSLGAVPNLQDDAQILEAIGVGFGREETLLLSKSIAKLAARTKAKSLRLWGKILGTGNDYYVAEGRLDHAFSDEVPSPDCEPHGVGVNRNTF